ncbi:modulator of FtsH protease HflK [Methylomarinovum caldicuralii]|uniref:Protein HflK n=1 Tax=Methylomarinovum caldicuralii TaxID=438856 RepID=A0AAU9BQP7_9GAMM|nr:FtsH protease activity modulator HflK [Methylomarinovum caldicuralii]BCX80786.1 modulator of FtsH protease HflK [Methylomarinovum caldicuralii]
MSWNEPGGGKKDPWSGQEPGGSPPDLEEIIRSLQEKIGRLFGGGGGGAAASAFVVWALVGIVFILWLLSGFYIVDEGNRGVVTRFGRYTETTMPGLHWHIPYPVEAVDIVDVEHQRFLEVGYRTGVGSVPQEALMLTGDENIVDVRLAVQYTISSARDFLFNINDPEKTLREVTESALREVVGQHTMDFVLTEGRSEIAADVKKLVQQIMNSYGSGIAVETVNLVDAQPPEEVQAAFEDAIKAREDKQRFINEAQAYANEVIPKARGQAARILEEAQGYKQKMIAKAQGEASRFEQILAEYEQAPEVTRTRLYLDALEAVFSKTETIMVDVKGGNNLLYLPLDRFKAAPAPNLPHSQPVLSGPAAAQQMLQRQPLRRVVRSREGRGR